MTHPLTNEERKIAATIVRENSKWARQRSMPFVAEERAIFAQRIEDGAFIDVELYRVVRERIEASTCLR